ncbi:MAG: PAS domain-containing protein, partial [Desulfobacterales bacterium]
MSEKNTSKKQNKRRLAPEPLDTDRKQVEAHLKLFKKLVESATDAIGISTPAGRHWFQNAAFDALFGNIGGDPPATLYCDENVGREVFETIMAGGEFSGEVQMYAADGRVLDILLRAYALSDETGRVLGLVGVHTDITASKRSQELFKMVALATNDVFYEWNVQTDSLKWFSDIAEELGYDSGDVAPTIDGWIKLIHPEDREKLAGAVEEHRTATHEIYYIYRVKHKNGTWRYWRDHATPVLDNRNRPLRWVGGISDITESKLVENAYKESEARFRQITENIREVFWLFDWQAQRVLYVSPAYELIWGRSCQSLYERYENWGDSIHPDDRTYAQETFNRILDTGGGEPREYRIVRPDDSERWISDTGYAIRDGDGKIVRIAGVAEDITERKMAEEALANKAVMEHIISDASRRFLTLTELDKSIDACLADIGCFSAADRAYLFQFTPDGSTMNNTHEWCAHDVKPEIDNLQGLPVDMFPWWMKMLEAGNNIHVKEVAKLPPEARAEKEILEAQEIKSVLVVPLVVENRLEGFLGLDNVVFARAWGEKELVPLRTLAEIIGTAITRKRAEQALRESMQTSADIVQAIPAGLFIYQFEEPDRLVLLNANPEAERLTGIRSDQWKGREFNEIWPESRKRGITGHFLNVIRTGISFETEDFYYEDKRLAGAFRIRAFPLPENRLAVGFENITERKQAEEEREKLRAKLIQAQKMEAIGNLAGGIAHNFNNILMGVQGRTSLMMMDKNSSDPDYEHLTGIEAYIKNAVELTRDLLGFARGGKYDAKPTDLNVLIDNENRLFGNTKKEIRIHSRFAEDLWTVEADRGQVQQVLLNLYVNAWQAMPGGGDLYIQTDNVILDENYIKPFDVRPGAYVRVSITDTGMGMDAETREKIFDPFFSTKDAGQGSGLGLASVYGIVKNHGGFINVYSEKGKGSTFSIYLPASEKPVTKEGPEPKRREIYFGRGTVLLVDDENMIIEVGRKILEKI